MVDLVPHRNLHSLGGKNQVALQKEAEVLVKMEALPNCGSKFAVFYSPLHHQSLRKVQSDSTCSTFHQSDPMCSMFRSHLANYLAPVQSQMDDECFPSLSAIQFEAMWVPGGEDPHRFHDFHPAKLEFLQHFHLLAGTLGQNSGADNAFHYLPIGSSGPSQLHPAQKTKKALTSINTVEL